MNKRRSASTPPQYRARFREIGLEVNVPNKMYTGRAIKRPVNPACDLSLIKALPRIQNLPPLIDLYTRDDLVNIGFPIASLRDAEIPPLADYLQGEEPESSSKAGSPQTSALKYAKIEEFPCRFPSVKYLTQSQKDCLNFSPSKKRSTPVPRYGRAPTTYTQTSPPSPPDSHSHLDGLIVSGGWKTVALGGYAERRSPFGWGCEASEDVPFSIRPSSGFQPRVVAISDSTRLGGENSGKNGGESRHDGKVDPFGGRNAEKKEGRNDVDNLFDNYFDSAYANMSPKKGSQQDSNPGPSPNVEITDPTGNNCVENTQVSPQKAGILNTGWDGTHPLTGMPDPGRELDWTRFKERIKILDQRYTLEAHSREKQENNKQNNRKTCTIKNAESTINASNKNHSKVAMQRGPFRGVPLETIVKEMKSPPPPPMPLPSTKYAPKYGNMTPPAVALNLIQTLVPKAKQHPQLLNTDLLICDSQGRIVYLREDVTPYNNELGSGEEMAGREPRFIIQADRGYIRVRKLAVGQICEFVNKEMREKHHDNHFAKPKKFRVPLRLPDGRLIP